VSVNGAAGEVYFQGNAGSVYEQHLFAVTLSGGEPRRLTRAAGEHRAGAGQGHFVDWFSALDTPPQIHLLAQDGKSVRVLVENPIPELKEHALGRYELWSTPAADGTSLNGLILKPRDFDDSRRYPVLLYAYGGPGAQVVKDRSRAARGLWEQYLG
jgi:dipeptidyl-peptidase-4